MLVGLSLQHAAHHHYHPRAGSHGAVKVRIRLGGDAPGTAAHVRGRPVRLRVWIQSVGSRSIVLKKNEFSFISVPPPGTRMNEGRPSF